MRIMKICLKWVHMARYELILRLDGALWLTIISKPPLTPRRAIKIQNLQKYFKKYKNSAQHSIAHLTALEPV